MKTCFLILTLCFSLFCSGQSVENYINDSIKKVRVIENEKNIEDQLKKDFKNVSFLQLNELIINEIISQNNKENIVFCYHSVANEQKIWVNATDIVPTYNTENPVYNAKHFWTEKNIRSIIKRWKKNLIPTFDQQGDSFVTNEKDSKEEYYLRYKNSAFFELVRRQTLGKYIRIDGKYRDEKDIYYFPYDEQKLNLTDRNNDRNFGMINLDFRNRAGKIIVVKLNENYKTYQHQGKKWMEIPTIDAYKF